MLHSYKFSKKILRFAQDDSKQIKDDNKQIKDDNKERMEKTKKTARESLTVLFVWSG